MNIPHIVKKSIFRYTDFMTQDISITLSPEKEKDENFIRTLLFSELDKKGIKAQKEETSFVFVKKSVDARHGRVKLVLRYKAYIGERPESDGTFTPKWKNADGKKSVLIIGSGPAGLFGALKLLEYGIKPIVIERGSDAGERKKMIASISTKGIVDSDTNYCFGEGGAGTFSDGKLYTRSNKRGNISEILALFHYFGADEKILTDAHPHIGTDRLPKIIMAMREKIIELGGEIHFNTRCVSLITKIEDEKKCVKGIRAENTLSGKTEDFFADAILLATGHSASDIYKMIATESPQSLEAKTFAVGVRVEHPREVIDTIQYHGKDGAKKLGAAEYRFTTQQEGRGVYSFCMCPGGFVVPSASGPDEIVVNGMSAAGRNSAWSNAAVVVETRPEDIPMDFRTFALGKGCEAMAGLLWRDALEKITAQNGEGQKAPAQRLVDFLDDKKSGTLPRSSYAPGLVCSDLNSFLPKQISSRLKSAFREVNKSMKGYICDDALLIASETRTSTPVRIVRDKESGECIGLKNLYPAGEGSGYSGGIVSSAMDGINQCVKIVELGMRS